MRRAWAIATAFFAALAALAYGLLPPGFALRWDNIGQNFPAVLEVYRQLSEGRWPLWDPYMWSGSPLLADPQSQALYPPAWLAFALTAPDHTRAFDLQYALHLMLGGWFSFAYLRTLGTTPAGALLGAAVWACNPHFMYLGTGFTNWYTTFAWIPLILYATERVSSGAWRWLALGAAAFALQLFAGFPQIPVYTALLVVPYGVVRAAGGSAAARAVRSAAGVGVVVCGACLAAVLLLPATEFWAASQRATPLPPSFEPPAMSGREIAGVVLPGLPAAPSVASNVWTHLGLVPCVLALAALWRPDALRLFFALAGAGALLLCVGPATPAFAVLGHVPLLRLFRGAIKFFPIAVLAVSTLAALGLSDAQRGRGRCLLWLLVAGLATCLAEAPFIAGWSAGLRPLWASSRYLWQWGLTTAFTAALLAAAAIPALRRALPALAIAATLAAMAVEATAYARPNGLTIRLVYERTPELRLLREPVPPLGLPGRAVWRGTQGLYHRVETANGYSGMLNGAYAKATGWGQHGIWVPWQLGIDALRGSNRILDVLGVRFVAVPRYHADAVSRLPGIGGEPRFRVAATLWDIVLFENLQPLPRVYLATQVAAVPDQDAAVRALRAGQIDPWRTPVVEEPIPALAAGAADEARLALLTVRGDRLEAQTESAHDALLVVSGAFDPGWQARVDQQPRRILRVNALTRGVVVPPGRHRVELFYWPSSFTRGAVLSVASATLLLGALLAGALRDHARA